MVSADLQEVVVGDVERGPLHVPPSRRIVARILRQEDRLRDRRRPELNDEPLDVLRVGAAVLGKVEEQAEIPVVEAPLLPLGEIATRTCRTDSEESGRESR